MNYRRNSEEDELSDSSSDNEYSKKNKIENGENMYEEITDSDIDEKEQANRMNDTGVVDVTYAQRTVWLVKVLKFNYILENLLTFKKKGSRFLS